MLQIEVKSGYKKKIKMAAEDVLKYFLLIKHEMKPNDDAKIRLLLIFPKQLPLVLKKYGPKPQLPRFHTNVLQLLSLFTKST